MADDKRKKFGGRSKGTPNKKDEDARAALAVLLNSNLKTLAEDMLLLPPASRVKYTLELAKFCIPTLKAIEHIGPPVNAERPLFIIGKTPLDITPKEEEE